MGTTADKLQAIWNSTEAIRVKLGIAEDTPLSKYVNYINTEPTIGGSAEYYKCNAVGPAEDTPTVPDFPQSTALPEEYLLVSGCSVSDTNGLYKLKDRNAVGYERQWVKMSGGATFIGDAENGCYALMYDGGASMMLILSGDSPIGSYTDNLPNGTENGVVVTQYEEEYVYQFKIEGEAGNPSCLGEYTLEDTSTMAVWRKWVNSNEKAYVNWATDRWYIYTTDEGWNMPCYQSSITTADVPPTDSSLTWTTAAGTTPIPTISPVGTSDDNSSSGNSTDIIVSGAVVSGTNGDPNGTYRLVDPETTGKERQWRNESGCWIIWQTYSDEDDAPGFWSLSDVDPDEEIADITPGEWIFVGSDQYEGTAESPVDETWINGNYDGYGDTLPTFTWASGGSDDSGSSSGNSTDIIVSGCGYEAANGTYYQPDSTLSGQNRVWVNRDNELITIAIEWDMSPETWLISDDGLYVAHGTTGGLDNPVAETEWDDTNGLCDGKLPVLSWASAEPEIAPNTWNGQKAILLTDEETGKPYYEFEETVTEGLTFGNGFTPVVDGIYDREALVKVNLYQRIILPTQGLVFYEPFNGTLKNNFTQLASSPEFSDMQGRSCMFVDHDHRLSLMADNLPSGNDPRCLSVMLYITQQSDDWGFYIGYGGDDSNTFNITVNSGTFRNYYRNGGLELGNVPFNTWCHVVMNFDGTTMKCYINGVLSGQFTKTYQTDITNYPLYVGYLATQASSSFKQRGYIAAARLYNRALTEDEIKTLASEFAN